MEHNPLDTRKQTILKAVVNDYVQTAEPVGSQALVRRYQLGVKSATIRNELAELSHLGYLHQPHTSAGRIPSQMGYRFYVDRLMQAVGVDVLADNKQIQRLLPRPSQLETIIEETCRLLSSLARYTSVATRPLAQDARVAHVSVAKVSGNKLLIVVALDNGRVLHLFTWADATRTLLEPLHASKYLSLKLVGASLQLLAGADNAEIDNAPPSVRPLLSEVMSCLRAELEASEPTDVHLEGANYIMQQPEFKDVERLEMVLSALERRQALYRLLTGVYATSGVTVLIGSENPIDEMRDCSFVGAKYRIHGKVVGTIGLIGPTRMDYGRAVSAVEYISKCLGELLTSMRVS